MWNVIEIEDVKRFKFLSDILMDEIIIYEYLIINVDLKYLYIICCYYQPRKILQLWKII